MPQLIRKVSGERNWKLWWRTVFLVLAGSALAMAAPQRAKESHPSKTPARYSPLKLKNKLVFTRGRPPQFDYAEDGTGIWTANEFVWIMNPDGSGQTRVWRVPKGYGQFGGFSADGTQALSYNRFNVYVHDLKTRGIRHIFLHSGGWATHISNLSFSQDGRRVLVVAGSGNAGYLSASVYVLDPSQPWRSFKEREKFLVELPSQGPDDYGDLHEPTFSPDGKRLAASFSERSFTYPETYTGPWNIWTLNVDGSAPRKITSNPPPLKWDEQTKQARTLDLEPSFSSDGKQIAFVRRVNELPGDVSDIWLVDTSGKNPKRVTNYEKTASSTKSSFNGIWNLYFSSDGRYLAFNQTFAKRQTEIYTINVEVGENAKPAEPKRLTNGALIQWVR